MQYSLPRGNLLTLLWLLVTFERHRTLSVLSSSVTPFGSLSFPQNSENECTKHSHIIPTYCRRFLQYFMDPGGGQHFLRGGRLCRLPPTPLTLVARCLYRTQVWHKTITSRGPTEASVYGLSLPFMTETATTAAVSRSLSRHPCSVSISGRDTHRIRRQLTTDGRTTL